MSADSPPISVQLYSVRDDAAKGFEGVLRRLGEIGFVGVEVAGFHDLTPKQYAAIVVESGLVTSSIALPDVSASSIGMSPPWCSPTAGLPWALLVGLKWPPALDASAALQSPTSCTCTPWLLRGSRLDNAIRTVTVF